jgi:ATP-binding cassette subfamily B protein
MTRYFQVHVRHAERASRQAVGLQNTHLQEMLGGVEVIRAFGSEAVFITRFRAALREGLVAHNRATVYSALYIPLMAILSAMAMALVLWIGVAGQGMLAALDISLGTLTAFVLLLQRFAVPIMSLGNEWQTVQAALASLERIFQVLALPSEQPAPAPQRQSHARSNAAIEMRQVVFGYQPGRPVLHGVSLAAQPGEHIVLVGRTGAGKSSVLHLLGGLYTPWSGTVRVAGADPTLLTDAQRRRTLGVVLQVVQLFRGTVLDNLTLGDASVSREAVQRAAAIAGAEAFIQALPQGYDTLLGSGIQLSAGQCQLLALARTLVWDPAVLLLDEATAAVDSTSEAAFRSALQMAVIGRKRTVLTVAHRLTTAQEADRVLLMEAGQIVEAGSPEALIRRGGGFAALLELEAAGWDWQAAGDASGRQSLPRVLDG